MGMLKFVAIVAVIVILICLAATQESDTNTNSSLSIHHYLLPPYKDARRPVAVRVKDLLSRMTLDEKIGQMIQIHFSVSNSSNIEQYKIGSILSGGDFPAVVNGTALQYDKVFDGYQLMALKTRLAIPMIFGIDAVHGHNELNGATIYPHNVGLGCTREPELLARIGAATALEVRATGISYTFAPSISVCRDPRWGRCYESYSEDPEVVSSMTTIIDGLQGKAPHGWKGPYVQNSYKLVACAKHFVGDGGTTKGINENNTVISYEDLVDIHMKAYIEAIARGVSTIMVSYSTWNGVKMHANRFLLTDVLKGQLGFKGFVISDWRGLDKLTDPVGANYSYSVFTGIHAGIDMVIVPFAYKSFHDLLKRDVTDGVIPMSRINDAVSRILQVKFQAGLFEKPYANKNLKSTIGSPPHRELGREAVRKSLVLLKNGKKKSNPMLPLDRNAKKILVVGSHANDIGLQCGGWTHSWQGSSGNYTKGTTILAGIQQTMNTESEIVYIANPKTGDAKGKGYKYAIVVVGEQPYAENHGDNNNLTIPAPFPQMIKETCADVACLVVMVSGRPLVVEQYMVYMDAFVAAWLPGTEARGIADVVFGDYEFQGKLSQTWFRNVNQLPMNVGDEHYDPLFPFGYGLKMGLECRST